MTFSINSMSIDLAHFPDAPAAGEAGERSDKARERSHQHETPRKAVDAQAVPVASQLLSAPSVAAPWADVATAPPASIRTAQQPAPETAALQPGTPAAGEGATALERMRDTVEALKQAIAQLPEAEQKTLAEEVERAKDEALKSAVDMKFDPSKFGQNIEVLYGIMQAMQSMIQTMRQLNGQLAILAKEMAHSAAKSGVSAAQANYVGAIVTAVFAVGLASGSLALHSRSSQLSHKDLKHNRIPAQREREAARAHRDIVDGSNVDAANRTQLSQTSRALSDNGANLDLNSQRYAIQIAQKSAQGQVVGGLAMPLAALGGATQQPVAAQHQGEVEKRKADQNALNDSAREAGSEADKAQEAFKDAVRTVQTAEQNTLAVMNSIASQRA
ncbi:hypothetical protein [Pseudomonas typographi]|uniref:Uncharacterized protein n=1 Tax=Pseudomonas typographi TaxID=2715964 RepID=A0ABR7Z212_9PSED|nr:hypothetical protein [Pseudomonas typographi]MBD1599524.1 hypothetical protein [Pseudomonas typographi]